VSEQAPSYTVYFDTNVISHINSGLTPDFLGVLTVNGHKLVLSDIVLEELPDKGETRILAQYPFIYLLAHEAANLDGKINFYQSVEPASNSETVDAIDLFLRGILRSVAGSRSVDDLNDLFRNSMDAVSEEMAKDLPRHADARLVDQLAKARLRHNEGLDLLPPVPSPIVTKEEMEALKIAPKHVNNVRPPSVVAKVLELYPGSSEWIGKLLEPFEQREDIKSRVQELCLALIMMGFARDRGIGSDNDVKSDSGARAQFQDIAHICAGSVCDLFVTSDKRCAKLAFAVFEALRLRTAVCCIHPSASRDVKLLVVGTNYWP
jgi:hypothetical protein